VDLVGSHGSECRCLQPPGAVENLALSTRIYHESPMTPHDATDATLRVCVCVSQPTAADIERLTFFHPMNRVHFPYGFASGPL
jgi:hypothetical protein